MFTIFVIATFFLLDIVAIYFASRNTLSGINNLHQSIRSITQVRQLRQLLMAQQQFLKKASTGPLSQDEIIIFKETIDKTANFFAINLDLTKHNPDINKLIMQAKTTLEPLNTQSSKIIEGLHRVKINSMVVDQYNLEAQDLLGKIQLVLAEDSDHIFNNIYESRFRPLIVGLMLTTVFLLFVLWMGINLKHKIDKPVQNIIEAAKRLGDGEFSARAAIKAADEIGVLAYVFNIMAVKLEENASERDSAAKELLAAKDAADAANLAKSAFLANMSHEIRTPLGAVLGFAELVTDPNVRPSEKANFAAAVKRNGELLSNIINDILDLSKIEANKMQVVTHETALIEILSDTKTLLDLQAKEKGITLNIAIDQNVPEIVKTDPLRLRQILINIIGNAIKFTSKGNVDVKVMLKTDQNSKNQLVIVVKDTGNGISEDQVGKLFEPFSQIDTTSKRKFGGTGLGLVISKRFANLLGGDVELTQTTLGKGSTFTITIDPGPIHSVRVEDAKKNFVELQKKSLRLDGIKILLAEDSPDNQTLISRMLMLAGATVELASDGKEAVDKARKNHYDVLLMDLQMPVMDGYEAIAELHKKGYKGKIVALTAHTLSEDRERSLKSGFDDHIGKPINRDLLIERVYLWSHKDKMSEVQHSGRG